VPELPFFNRAVLIAASDNPSFIKLDRDAKRVRGCHNEVIPVLVDGALENLREVVGLGIGSIVDVDIQPQTFNTSGSIHVVLCWIDRGVPALSHDKIKALSGETYASVEPGYRRASLDPDVLRQAPHVTTTSCALGLVDGDISIIAICKQ